jgi:hypothetical protein
MFHRQNLWQHPRLAMKNLNGGGSAQELWCVELVPTRKKFSRADKEEAVRFAKGMPSAPDKALVWMAQAFTDLGDYRTAHFAWERQRLVVFKEKARAAERARRETNEYWRGFWRDSSPVNVLAVPWNWALHTASKVRHGPAVFLGGPIVL